MSKIYQKLLSSPIQTASFWGLSDYPRFFNRRVRYIELQFGMQAFIRQVEVKLNDDQDDDQEHKLLSFKPKVQNYLHLPSKHPLL